ncbi:MAG: DUF2283 domain-containing protein [Dehalococcoidia bacterium]|nr:MAG: DUF2283 domain-containing protein [Dehalococcoidia bacterium]
MKITYDSKYDVLYLKFTDESPQVVTQRVNEDVGVDFDADGRIVGIEVLSASKYLDLGSLLPVSVKSG